MSSNKQESWQSLANGFDVRICFCERDLYDDSKRFKVLFLHHFLEEIKELIRHRYTINVIPTTFEVFIEQHPELNASTSGSQFNGGNVSHTSVYNSFYSPGKCTEISESDELQRVTDHLERRQCYPGKFHRQRTTFISQLNELTRVVSYDGFHQLPAANAAASSGPTEGPSVVKKRRLAGKKWEVDDSRPKEETQSSNENQMSRKNPVISEIKANVDDFPSALKIQRQSAARRSEMGCTHAAKKVSIPGKIVGQLKLPARENSGLEVEGKVSSKLEVKREIANDETTKGSERRTKRDRESCDRPSTPSDLADIKERRSGWISENNGECETERFYYLCEVSLPIPESEVWERKSSSVTMGALNGRGQQLGRDVDDAADGSSGAPRKGKVNRKTDIRNVEMNDTGDERFTEFNQKQLENNDFSIIHRRMEWLSHFYINAMSPIDLDSRWRVFVIFRSMQRSPSDLTLSLTKEHVEKENGLCNWMESSPNINIAESGSDVKNDEARSYLKVPGLSNELLKNPSAPFEIIGYTTVYQFFSLPKERARISQFFILPNRQRLGLGRQVLKALCQLLTADPNIRQISVEDPSFSFQRLRDTVSIERAIEGGLLSVDCLYYKKITFDQFPTNPENWIKYKTVFTQLYFETPQQRHRIKLILDVARLLPDVVDNNSKTKTDSNLWNQSDPATPAVPAMKTDGSVARRMAWAPPISSSINFQGLPYSSIADISQQLTSLFVFEDLEALKAIRIKEKRRFRIESCEWYSQYPRSTVLQELEKEWTQLFQSILSSIYALRRIFSSQPTAEKI